MDPAACLHPAIRMVLTVPGPAGAAQHTCACARVQDLDRCARLSLPVWALLAGEVQRVLVVVQEEASGAASVHVVCGEEGVQGGTDPYKLPTAAATVVGLTATASAVMSATQHVHLAAEHAAEGVRARVLRLIRADADTHKVQSRPVPWASVMARAAMVGWAQGAQEHGLAGGEPRS